MKKFVIKSGAFEEKKQGKKQPGLDLSRTTLDTLVDKGLASTSDCCCYIPFTIKRIPLVDGNANSGAIVKYVGTSAPVLTKNDDTEWTLEAGSCCEILSADIRLVSADSSGSTGILNIKTKSPTYNQGNTTMRIPSVTGLILDTNHYANINSADLDISVGTPSDGDIVLTFTNWETVFTNDGALIKLVF